MSRPPLVRVVVHVLSWHAHAPHTGPQFKVYLEPVLSVLQHASLLAAEPSPVGVASMLYVASISWVPHVG